MVKCKRSSPFYCFSKEISPHLEEQMTALFNASLYLFIPFISGIITPFKATRVYSLLSIGCLIYLGFIKYGYSVNPFAIKITNFQPLNTLALLGLFLSKLLISFLLYTIYRITKKSKIIGIPGLM